MDRPGGGSGDKEGRRGLDRRAQERRGGGRGQKAGGGSGDKACENISDEATRARPGRPRCSDRGASRYQPRLLARGGRRASLRLPARPHVDRPGRSGSGNARAAHGVAAASPRSLSRSLSASGLGGSCGSLFTHRSLFALPPRHGPRREDGSRSAGLARARRRARSEH